VALLSLAEAFLRVPDPETADQLIADKLGNADWRAHAGKSHSTLVNSATWGLVIGRALVSETEQASALKKLISRAGEPFVRQAVGAAMRMMGEIFVMGRTIDEAVARMRRKENRGFTASFDMLGEAARTFPDAERYFRAYEGAIHAVGRQASEGHSISVKLSALHPRYEVAQYDRCVPNLIEQVEALATLAKRYGIAFTIDAEESERLEMSLDIISAVAGLPGLAAGTGSAWRSRLMPSAAGRCWPGPMRWAPPPGGGSRSGWSRAPIGTARSSARRSRVSPNIRSSPARRRPTCPTSPARATCCAPGTSIPPFATHNALTVAKILEWAGESRDFEFQRLHGMGEGSTRRWCASRATTRASTRPWAGIATCWPIWCADCWRMARIPASCTSSPTRS
jgi:RHH-type proline utilization regulon transcriptional repressor/proline dehydrogenase/delta 1-pyrroline-5-carboxylate dehydrogenase